MDPIAILDALNELGPATTGRLLGHLLETQPTLDRATLEATLEELERRGWVDRPYTNMWYVRL